MLMYILLGLINYNPASGYELKQIIDRSTGYFWHAHHSQIYTTLRRMEDKGLVISTLEESDGRERRVYDITDKGRSDFEAWLESPMTTIGQYKEELLVRVFFSGSRDIEDVLAELQMQRALRARRLEEYKARRMQETYAKHASNELDIELWQATLDFGIKHEAMYLDWLDEVIARLQTKRHS